MEPARSFFAHRVYRNMLMQTTETKVKFQVFRSVSNLGNMIMTVVVRY